MLFFSELGFMLPPLFGAIRTRTWTFLPRGLRTCACGVHLPPVVANWHHEESRAGGVGVADLFGSFGDTVFTRCKACLGGMGWGNAVQPLMRAHPVYAIATSPGSSPLCCSPL